MESPCVGKYITPDFLHAVCVFMFILLSGCPQLAQGVHKLLLWSTWLNLSKIIWTDDSVVLLGQLLATTTRLGVSC